MTREWLLDCSRGETRAVLLEDGRPAEFRVERSGAAPPARVGNIYKAKVGQGVAGVGSAFVDIGTGKNAFLHEDDTLPGFKSKKGRAVQGADMLVQIVKEGVGDKGPRVTMRLSLPGHALVLMPGDGGVGISKQVAGGARDRLYAQLAAMRPEGAGLIARTAAAEMGEDALRAELAALEGVWDAAQKRASEIAAPALVRGEDGLAARIVRDARPGTRIMAGDETSYRDALASCAACGSGVEVVLERAPGGLLAARGLREKCKKLLGRKIFLNSGGFVTMDQTEAMTVADVNTGKYTGKKDAEETALKINTEAAREIARLIRFRDIGGIVVIDFIDMIAQSGRDAVLRALEEELSCDAVPSHVLGFTRLGLVEMTRKRARGDVVDALKAMCPVCGGDGRVWSDESVARFGLEDSDRLLDASDAEVELSVHPQAAEAALALADSQRIRIKPDARLPRDQSRVKPVVGNDKKKD